MAKWGEGDPRWIVEDRPDHKNVNNWHWTEKDASGWSREKLRQLLDGLVIEHASIGRCEITELSEITGEATANNRKGKLIFLYEWVLKLKWKGKCFGKEKEVTGTIEIPNLSDENTADEVDIEVATKGNSSESNLLLEMMKSKGKEAVRNKILEYMTELRDRYAQDLILPTKSSTVENPASTSSSMGINSTNSSAGVKLRTEPIKKEIKRVPTERGSHVNVGDLELEQQFHCRAEELYRALTVPDMIRAFTGGNAELEVKPGGKFILFGGNVSGSFEELVENEKIVQSWRFQSWQPGHHSRVVFSLKDDPKEGNTILQLKQTGVPIQDIERTREGWKRYYWDAMKRTFGFGSFLC
ncbi:unnamed protein product [Cyprideis torosa]|uniref:Uncharacterized protein n=1 Tax=Cyprideis torosa TaxID=163714 RepID=A0A7R8ZJR3_9CRUS|nr:unnamed protein product [Cyprideis torosa]CAG0880188.1 unnamed protein product [Cyprideis torosa]